MTIKSLDVAGIFPPVPTAFNEELEVDHQQLSENIRTLSQFDLQGLVVLGSNGEFVLLDEDEKTAVIRTARESMPPQSLLFAGTGCPSTRATIRSCSKAADAGADAALVITPSYYKGKMTDAALLEFFGSVATSSPIPVILYNMPTCTGIDLSAEIVVSLASHPNILGLKDSGGNLGKLGEIVYRTNGDFQVLAGSAGFLLPAFAVGAIGGILALANIAPGECLQIRTLFQKGKMEEARKLQSRLIPLNQQVTKIGGVSVLKSAMDYLGLYGGPVRGPLLPAGKEEIKRVRSLINDAGIEGFS
ncbi:MAG: 4-hydroxy-tetrahydrodipicolinate synthase [Gammaproteobacteria bacterium]|nr:4-hydroxy-tetrahydrodipicolinate synthase [Gammaproteobacteria bacterium]